MHNDKDLYVADIPPTVANHCAFKAGLIVAGVALILNAASDTFMLSLLKPLLDDGFGKTDRSVLVWMPLVVIGLMILRGITSYVSSYCISGIRKGGNDYASPPVWSHDGNACFIF